MPQALRRAIHAWYVRDGVRLKAAAHDQGIAVLYGPAPRSSTPVLSTSGIPLSCVSSGSDLVGVVLTLLGSSVGTGAWSPGDPDFAV